jgi:hypothetical protein
MPKNSVGDVADLANVKQLNGQVVAQGGPDLGFDGYLDLLLSTCSMCDKLHTTPHSGQRQVYATSMGYDTYSADNGVTYGVKTDVQEILAYAADMRYKAPLVPNKNGDSPFIPRDEWMKLAPEKREEIIAQATR